MSPIKVTYEAHTNCLFGTGKIKIKIPFPCRNMSVASVSPEEHFNTAGCPGMGV